MRRSWPALAILCSAIRAEDPPVPEVVHATLGVKTRALTFEEARAIGREEAAAGAGPGVAVVEVAPEGAAGESGLRPGDVVIAIDDHPVHNDDQLQDRIRVGAPGTRVVLGVLRSGDPGTKPVELNLAATLGKGRGPAWEGIAWEFTGPDGLQLALERARAEKRRVLVGTSGSEAC
ncbi:MAG: PDZ domain-containing protein [Candidatus Brocadiae bacterium]|nr:PDZ domain-containing protein [Candidatus Brocadiia bacterium]